MASYLLHKALLDDLNCIFFLGSYVVSFVNSAVSAFPNLSLELIVLNVLERLLEKIRAGSQWL